MNVFLIVGALVITGCIVAVTYFLIQALKAVTRLAERLKESTEDLKDKMGFKVLAAVPPILVTLISRFFKRGR